MTSFHLKDINREPTLKKKCCCREVNNTKIFLIVSFDGCRCDEFRKEKKKDLRQSNSFCYSQRLKSLEIHWIVFYVKLLASECEKETGSQTEKSPRGFNLELCHRWPCRMTKHLSGLPYGRPSLPLWRSGGRTACGAARRSDAIEEEADGRHLLTPPFSPHTSNNSPPQ